MKLWLFGLFPCLFALPVHSHPLEGAVRELNKVAAEIDSAKQNASKDQQEDIDALLQQTSQLWLSSVVMPFKTSDARLSRLGYQFVPPKGDANLGPELRKSENFNELQRATDDLKPSVWRDLLPVIDEQMQLSDDAVRLATQAEFNSSILQPAQHAALQQIGRGSELKRLKKYVSSQIDCINLFAVNFPAKGLVPVDSGDGFQWSDGPMIKTYGTSDISSLTGDAHDKVAQALSELWTMASQNRTCLSKAKFEFLGNENLKFNK